MSGRHREWSNRRLALRPTWNETDFLKLVAYVSAMKWIADYQRGKIEFAFLFPLNSSARQLEDKASLITRATRKPLRENNAVCFERKSR